MRFTDGKDIVDWVHALNQLDLEGTTRCPDFLKPFHFTLLGMRLRSMEATRLELPRPLMRYALRMGLWKALSLPPPAYVVERSETGRFFPLRGLMAHDQTHEVGSELAAIVREQSARCDEETHTSIYTALVELIENCFAHSETPHGRFGLVCAQTWKGGDLAQIAIADSGIGIRGSLAQSERWRQQVQHRNCCELASEYGVTSKPMGHSGYGLTLVRGLATEFGGNLVIASGTELFSAGSLRTVRATIQELPGTLVIYEWRPSIRLDTRQIYESWPASGVGE